MKAIYITCAFLLSIFITAAQSHNVDSLKMELSKALQDSIKIKILKDLDFYYQTYKPDSTIYYARQLVTLSQRSNDKYSEAIGFSDMGYVLGHMGNYSRALEMQLKSLKIAEQLKERRQSSMGFTFLQIGLLERENGRYANAIANFKKCILLQKDRGASEASLYGIFSQMGSAYLALEKLDSALYYAKKGYALYLQAKDEIRSGLVFNVLGNVYEEMGNPNLAKNYYHTAIAKGQEIKANYNETKSYLDLAMLFKKQVLNDSCIFYAQKSLRLSKSNSYASYAIDGYNLLVQVYELQNEPDSTLKYLKLMAVQKDSVFSQAKMQQYQVLLFDEEQRQQQLKTAELNYQNRIRTYALLSVIIGSLVVAAILYRNNRQKQKANALLQQQQAKTERALEELKSTQAQLIQSEKMASLGELTAGIAHEIQNPLNFVNNFSEVNQEMVDEAVEEIDKENYEEVKVILNEIKDNSEKINHHGKRADAIVKGMLQHSQTSTGKNEPTDISALADEYLRLAYQGLRAKDQTFNATIKTDFDSSIGKINIIPQDIGRVLLNLYSNAFYAVNEKKKIADANYQPTFSVSTKNIGNKVEVKVTDNGPGIPQNIVDKIFQPFFTTKPTGQGTGLGLSLSYDIMKAHGGELKVETIEGEGSTFIISIPDNNNQ